jgi:hypothetical protein
LQTSNPMARSQRSTGVSKMTSISAATVSQRASKFQTPTAFTQDECRETNAWARCHWGFEHVF